MASLFVTTGTLVVLIPSVRTRVTLSPKTFFWSWIGVEQFGQVLDILWNVQFCGWMEHAVCISRGTVDHCCILLRMSFFSWCLLSKLSMGSVFVVQYKHPVSSLHRPRTGHSQGQHRQRWHICSSYTEGKNDLISILKHMIVSTWYENRECTGSVPVVSATSWIFSLLCKKTEFIQVLWRLRYF